MRWCSEAPQKKAEAGAGLVNFTLATPNNTFFRDQDVDSISLPGLGMNIFTKKFFFCKFSHILEGEFIVNSQLVPIITELKPGVVTVNIGATQQKFFISGGFVFVHEGSVCSVNPAECVGLENLDAELAKVCQAF